MSPSPFPPPYPSEWVLPVLTLYRQIWTRTSFPYAKAPPGSPCLIPGHGRSLLGEATTWPMGTQVLDSPQEAHGSTAAVPQDWSVRTPVPKDQVRTRNGKVLFDTNPSDQRPQHNNSNGHSLMHITKFHTQSPKACEKIQHSKLDLYLKCTGGSVTVRKCVDMI